MVSTKGRYALRVMIELAVRRDEGVVCLKEIAEHQQISEKYLEAIVKSLVSAGLVIGTRGKGGGDRLSCTAGAEPHHRQLFPGHLPGTAHRPGPGPGGHRRGIVVLYNPPPKSAPFPLRSTMFFNSY